MLEFVHDPRERSRFLKFAVVGVIGAVIDFGVMNTLVGFNLPFTAAGTISFIAAVISNFLWNRYWTYPDSRGKHVVGQMVQFFAVNTAGLAIRYPILHYVEPLLDKFFIEIPNIASYHEVLSHNITLAFAVGVVMMWNFLANRFWTYSDINEQSI